MRIYSQSDSTKSYLDITDYSIPAEDGHAFEGNPLKERQDYYNNMKAEQCEDRLKVERLTVLRFKDEAQVIIKIANFKNLDYQLKLFSSKKQEIAYTFSDNKIIANLPLNEDFVIKFKACNKEQFLANFSTLAHDREVPIEVTQSLFTALSTRPQTQKFKEFVFADNGVDFYEKLSFYQMHLFPEHFLKKEFKVQTDINASNKWGFDNSNIDDFSPIDPDGKVDDPFNRFDTVCKCSYVIQSGNYFSFVDNKDENSFDDLNDQNNGIDIHPYTKDIGTHTVLSTRREKWTRDIQLGAAVEKQLAHHGWRGWFTGADHTIDSMTNIDVSQNFPPSDIQSAAINQGHDLNYEFVKYRMECNVTELPSSCGCEKDITYSVKAGAFTYVNAQLDKPGPDRHAKAFVFDNAMSYTFEEGTPGIEVIGYGGKMFAAQCNSNWNRNWLDKLKGSIVGVVEIIAKIAASDYKYQDSTAKPIDSTFVKLDTVKNVKIYDYTYPLAVDYQKVFGTVVDQFATVSKLVGDLTDLFTINPITSSCVDNTNSGSVNFINKMDRITKLRPNKNRYILVSNFYHMGIDAKTSYFAESKIESYAALTTKLNGGAYGLPYKDGGGNDRKTSAQLCCSKKYGNWLIASLGKDVPMKTGMLQYWVSSFFSATAWDPQFPIMFWGGPDVTGNYGRISGPKPIDCIYPVPIPQNKTDYFIIQNHNNQIFLNNLMNEIGVVYKIMDISGRILKYGITTHVNESILNNSNQFADQLLIIHASKNNYSKTFKVSIL